MTIVPQPDSVTLYTYAMSPYAAKVHCFLLFKGVRFECFYINPLRARQDLPVGRKIPVLTIGSDSRADSTPIGLWLDERFPELPRLLPDSGDERQRLLEIDDWITHRLIPGSFRFFPGEGLNRWLNGWRLSHVMNKTARGGLPVMLRAAWPLVIHRIAFARRLRAMADDGLPLRESKHQLYRKFISYLDGGPFLAGRDAPALPDLAAYPQFVLYYVTEFRGSEDILRASRDHGMASAHGTARLWNAAAAPASRAEARSSVVPCSADLAAPAARGERRGGVLRLGLVRQFARLLDGPLEGRASARPAPQKRGPPTGLRMRATATRELPHTAPRLVAAALVCTVLGSPPPRAQSAECVGDCDGDGVVRIHELVRLVDAVFAAVCPIPEGCPVDPCLGLDADRDGVVTGSELVLAINRLYLAVGNALSGCLPSP